MEKKETKLGILLAVLAIAAVIAVIMVNKKADRAAGVDPMEKVTESTDMDGQDAEVNVSLKEIFSVDPETGMPMGFSEEDKAEYGLNYSVKNVPNLEYVFPMLGFSEEEAEAWFKAMRNLDNVSAADFIEKNLLNNPEFHKLFRKAMKDIIGVEDEDELDYLGEAIAADLSSYIEQVRMLANE